MILSTSSGGSAMVRPLVMVKERGAFCQSVTQVWSARLIMPRSVLPPPEAAVFKNTVGIFSAQPVHDGVKVPVIVEVGIDDRAVYIAIGTEEHIVVQAEDIQLISPDEPVHHLIDVFRYLGRSMARGASGTLTAPMAIS